MRLTFARFVFDSRLRAVLSDGEKVDLSPKAFGLLEALIEARPAPVPRQVLYDRLWPDTYVDPTNLHNLISEIRRALDDTDHAIVKTIHGVGYAFEGVSPSAARSPSRFVVWVGSEVLTLGLGETLIGRDPECGVIIDSADVSRQHARLFVADDHVVLEDLGSKNGTFIDGLRLTAPRILRGAADLTVGRTPVLLRKRGSVKSTATLNHSPIKGAGQSS